MNILYIDTRDNKQIIVRLETESKRFEEKSVANKDRAQTTLPLIEKVLKRARLEASQINEIKVENRGGSFTGLRIGIAIANALSFGLGIIINGKPLGEIETPQY